MTRHLLVGLAPTPLGNYLAALGVLRVIGEQADHSARGSWNGEHLILDTALDRSALCDFLLDDYGPTPVVSPWNGGSGFYPGDKQAIGQLERIEASTSTRLEPFRRTVAAAREVRESMDAKGWSREKDKATVVALCRATFPDEAVQWLDAAVVLTGDDVVFPTLLGSGGNLGRLELSATFHGLLGQVLCLRQGRGAPDRPRSRAWLEEALFNEGAPVLVGQSPGQFDPSATGGANSSPMGRGRSVVNPWDFVLLVEGALLFASGAARRLGAVTAGKLAMPFTVDASPVGYASRSQEEGSKGEVWAPLWERPASLPELARLLGEGRASWRDGQARNGLDFVRAAHSLGVDRGITSFVRHALVERLGQSMLAVPVAVTRVVPRPEVPLLGRIDPWVNRVRRAKEPPAMVRTALGALDEGIFEAAEQRRKHRRAQYLQQVLVLLAELEQAVARATAMRAQTGLRPVEGLRATEWIPLLDDGSPEFDLAATLAAGADRRGTGLRMLLQAVRWEQAPAPEHRTRGRLAFTDGGTRVEGLMHRPALEVLSDALVLRARDVLGRPPEDRAEGRQGLLLCWERSRNAGGASVAALLAGDLDYGRLRGLLAGLMLLDWDGARRRDDDDAHVVHTLHSASPAFGLLAPFGARGPLRSTVADGEVREALLGIQPGWPAQLRAGRVAEVLREAHLRLRMAGFVPGLPPDPASALLVRDGDGQRLAAALLVPLQGPIVAGLLTRVAPGRPAPAMVDTSDGQEDT